MQVLTEMVNQFVKKHGRKPEQIVVTPYATVALTLMSGISSSCGGLKIVSKEFDEVDVCQKEGEVARSLGVFVGKRGIVACDLKIV